MANELSEYMVISRGQWDADASPADIQAAIDQFYVWRDKLVGEGRMKGGQRLARESRLVTRQAVTDGPFSEAKEIIGGYWFFLAASLDEAAKLAAENPCLARGLVYEVRPVETAKASAYTTTSETPTRTR
ncbi:MAG TPA: YciI family protein [Burkholderiaceae bacterium]|nr:YciI family protein [Burkholderiaceae bacterium]